MGTLLRPAAVLPTLTQQPGSCRDDSVPVTAPELHATVQESASDLADVVGEVETWLADHVGALTDEAHQANLLAELAITDSSIGTVSDLADTLGVLTRTVNRLTTKYVGLSPYTMIRRRRLQEAVKWTREYPSDALAYIAVRFGFVDQAHLSREARTLLGLTPHGLPLAHDPTAMRSIRPQSTCPVSTADMGVVLVKRAGSASAYEPAMALHADMGVVLVKRAGGGATRLDAWWRLSCVDLKWC